MRSIWVKAAFVISILWWLYLFFTTQFVIVYDAEGYEQAGKLIAYHGWADYFRQALQREPMFPWLVALSMQLGDWLGCSYGYLLKLIGIFFLFLTMVFSYWLMCRLSVRPFIAAFVLLYIGISPVMTNSSMRIWSEFAIYPWVVLAVIWTIRSCKFLDNLPQDRLEYFSIIGHAMVLALIFLLIMFDKAVAEGILILYLWPFYGRVVSYLRSRDYIKSKQAAVFCLVVFLIFESVVGMYKWCNYHYNGNFAFTNRGVWLVYGSAVRRVQPLTLERLRSGLASVPGMGVCSSHYSPEDCNFWSGPYADGIWSQRLAELTHQGIKGNAAFNDFAFNTMKMVLAHPFQVLLLMAIEAQKMFFWESSLDFVTYPDWLDNILHTVGFSYSLRIIGAILSWVACVFAFCVLCFRCQRCQFKDKGQQQALFWTVNFIFCYIWMFSWVHILDRFSFPLISLFMVLISFLIERCVAYFFPGHDAPVPSSSKFSGWIVVLFLALSQVAWFWIAPGNFKAIWKKNPVVDHIIKENIRVQAKSKLVTLSYWAPNFEYLSKVVSGDMQPNIAMQAGYPAYYKEAVILFPDVDVIHYLLGFCEYYRGDLVKASTEYEKTIQLNPDFFWSYYNLGVIYFKQGEWLKSTLVLNKAISLRKEITLVDLNQNPFYWQTWHYLNDPEKTLEINLSEGIEDAALLLAVCAVKEGIYDQALLIIRSVGHAGWHQDLWKELQQKALQKQPTTSAWNSLLEEQVKVRLF